MDSHTLVNEEIEAGAEFVEQFGKTFPVKAAFWVKLHDAEAWNLYVICDELGRLDTRILSAEVLRVAREMQNPVFSPFQVKLAKSSDWVARQAAEIQHRRGLPIGTWFEGDSLGGMEIDGAYLYPPPVVQPSA